MSDEGQPAQIDWDAVEAPAEAGAVPVAVEDEPAPVDAQIDWDAVEAPVEAPVEAAPVSAAAPPPSAPSPAPSPAAAAVDWEAIEAPADLSAVEAPADLPAIAPEPPPPPVAVAPPPAEESPDVGEAVRALERMLPRAIPEGINPWAEVDVDRRLALLLEHMRNARLTTETVAAEQPGEDLLADLTRTRGAPGLFGRGERQVRLAPGFEGRPATSAFQEGVVPSGDPGYAATVGLYEQAIISQLRAHGVWDAANNEVSPGVLSYDERNAIGAWHQTSEDARPPAAFEIGRIPGTYEPGWDTKPALELTGLVETPGIEPNATRLLDAIITNKVVGNRQMPPSVRARFLERRLLGHIRPREAEPGRVIVAQDFPERDMVWPDSPGQPRTRDLLRELLASPWRPGPSRFAERDRTGRLPSPQEWAQAEPSEDVEAGMAPAGTDLGDAQREDARRFSDARLVVMMSDDYRDLAARYPDAPELLRGRAELEDIRLLGPTADPGTMPALAVGFDWVDFLSVLLRSPTRGMYSAALAEQEFEALQDHDRETRHLFLETVPWTDPRFSGFVNTVYWKDQYEDAAAEMERLEREGTRPATKDDLPSWSFGDPLGYGGEDSITWEDEDAKAEWGVAFERREDASARLHRGKGGYQLGLLRALGVGVSGGWEVSERMPGPEPLPTPLTQLTVANFLPATTGRPHADPYAMSGAVSPINFVALVDAKGRRMPGAKVGDTVMPGRIGYVDPLEIELLQRSKGGVMGLLSDLAGSPITQEAIESGEARRAIQTDSMSDAAVRNIGFHRVFRDQLVQDVVTGGDVGPLIANYGYRDAKHLVARRLPGSGRDTKVGEGFLATAGAAFRRFAETTGVSGPEPSPGSRGVDRAAVLLGAGGLGNPALGRSPRDTFLMHVDALLEGQDLGAPDPGTPERHQDAMALARRFAKAAEGLSLEEREERRSFDWRASTDAVAHRHSEDHASAIASGDLATGTGLRAGMSMILPDLGIAAAERFIPGLAPIRRIETPGGAMTQEGDRAAAEAISQLRGYVASHVRRLAREESDAVEATVRVDAERVGLEGLPRAEVPHHERWTPDAVQPTEITAARAEVVNATRRLAEPLSGGPGGPDSRISPWVRDALTDAEQALAEAVARVAENPVETAVAAARAEVARKWALIGSELDDAARDAGWHAVAQIGDEASSLGRLVDSMDLLRVAQVTDEGVEFFPMRPGKASPGEASGIFGRRVAAGPRTAEGMGPRAKGYGPDYTWREPRPAKDPGEVRAPLRPNATRAELLEDLAQRRVVPSDSGAVGLFYPRNVFAQTFGWALRTAQLEERGVSGLLRVGGKTLETVANADILGLARRAPRLPVVAVLEWGRRIVGKGRPWAVKDAATGSLRAIRPSDIIGYNEMYWFKWAQKEASARGQWGAYSVDEMVMRILDGTASKLDRKVATKWIEILGDPNPDTTLAGKMIDLLDRQLRRAASVQPARAGAEAKGDLARRISALKSIGKNWPEVTRAKHFREALASARAYAGEVGVNLDDLLRLVGAKPEAVLGDLFRLVGDDLQRLTGKSLDTAVEIFRSSDRSAKRWVKDLKKNHPDHHAMLRYWEAKTRPIPAETPLVGTAEEMAAWAKLRQATTKELEDLRAAANEASGRFTDDVAVLEKIQRELEAAYQPRSALELETDLMDRLRGVTRGAKPEHVAHRRKMILAVRQAASSPEQAEMAERLLDGFARTWAAVHGSPPELWWVKHYRDAKVGAKGLPRRRLSYFLMQRDLLVEETPGFFLFSNLPMGRAGMSATEVRAAMASQLQASLRESASRLLQEDYPSVNLVSQSNSAGYWKGEMENSLALHVLGKPGDMRAAAGAITLSLHQEATLFIRALDELEDFGKLWDKGRAGELVEIRFAEDVSYEVIDRIIKEDFVAPTDRAEREALLRSWTKKDSRIAAAHELLDKEAGALPGASIITAANQRPVLALFIQSDGDIVKIARGLEALKARGLDVVTSRRKVYGEFLGHKDAGAAIVENSRGKKAAAKRVSRYTKEGEAHARRYEDERRRVLDGYGSPGREVRDPGKPVRVEPGAPDPSRVSSVSVEGAAGIYSTNLGRFGLRDGVAFTLDDVHDVGRGATRPNVEQAIYRALGAEVAGGPTDIRIYPLAKAFRGKDGKLTRESVEARLATWLEKIGGWNYKVFGPDMKGGSIKPDFRSFNYSNRYVWIYQGGDANTFGDYAYTLAWRVTHEVAHARVEAQMIEKYGGAGRRAGALGIEVPTADGGLVHPPLSLPDALKAVEWEDLAFKEQRRILEVDFGVKITDEAFAKEYQLNLADAVRRVLTGGFSNPDVLGIVPTATRTTDEMLDAALRIVTEAATEMGLPSSRTFTEAKALGHTSTKGSISTILPEPATVEDVLEMLRKTRLVTDGQTLRMLGDQPTYLDAVIRYLDEIRTKFNAEGASRKQVAFAYGVTVASQGTGAVRLSTIQEKTGLHFGSEFTFRSKEDGIMIRPEDAAAAWFLTPDGVRALDSVETGVFDESLWQGLAAVRRAFGDDRIVNQGVLREPAAGAFSLQNIGAFTDAINAERGNLDGMLDLLMRAKGVGEGKGPFVQQLLTGSGKATVDARELNWWIGGGHPLTREDLNRVRVRTARITKKHLSNKRVAEHISGRIRGRIRALRKQGVGEDFDPEAFEVLVHHWIWDRVANTETTHSALYTARLDERLAQIGAGDVVKGAAEHHSDGRWTIHLLENSDFSTVAHEFMHPVVHYLPAAEQERLARWASNEATRLSKLMAKGELPKQLEHFWYDKDPSDGLVGALEGALTRDGHELVARAWERYLAEGVAPIKELRGTFDKISRFMLSIYKSVTGSAIDVRVTDSVRRVFDELLDFEKAEADQMVRRGGLADIVPPSMGKLPVAELLNKSAASALDQLSENAAMAREILEQMTGFGTVAEREAWGQLTKEIDSALGDTVGVAMPPVGDSYRAGRLSLNLTVAESRRATRATQRLLERGGNLLRDEWADLSPNVRQAVEDARSFFDHYYRRLKAVGRLKDWSREEFFERMLIEGYYAHYFTKKGQKALDRLVDGRAGKKYGDGLSDEFRSELRREIPSFAEDINKQVVNRIAEGLFEGERKAAGPTYRWAATPEAKEARIRQIIRKERLDRVEFYETDFAKVMQSYGKGAEQAIANQRWFNNLRRGYPEGDGFAAAARDSGVAIADRIAAESGFRRVDGAIHHRLLRGGEISPVWKELGREIEALVRSSDPTDVKENLFGLFRRHGYELTDVVRKETALHTSTHLYLPNAIADMVEMFGWKDFLQVMRESDNPLVKAMGLVGTSFDDMLNTWKSGVTVMYGAFHGRNWQSNAVANVMVHGPDGFSPVNQAYALAMMNAKDSDFITIPLGGIEAARAGRGITMTAKEWRDSAALNLVDTRVLSFADIERTAAQARLRQAPALAAGGLGGLVGGVAGAMQEEDPEKRLRAFAKYGFIGFFTGAAVKSNYDLFGSNAWKTLYKGGFSEKAWLASYDQLMDDAAETLRKGLSVGTGGAVLTHFLVPEFLGVSPLLGGATLATVSMAVEGLVALGGGVGVAIERQARMTGWVAGIRRGMSLESSAALVNKTLFNYDDLTYIEKYVLKRLFPFWTWTSKNALSLQPYLLMNHPRRYIVWNRFLSMLQKDAMQDIDMAMIPEEHRYRFIVSTGMGRYIAGWGLHQESISELMKTGPFMAEKQAPIGLISAMHPVLPFAVRMAGGLDPYYATDLRNVRTARDIEHLDERIQRWVGYRRMKNPTSGKVYHMTGYYPDRQGGFEENAELGAFRMALLRALPAWRLTNEYNVLARDTFVSGAMLQSEDVPDATPQERIARFLFGIKSYGYDVDSMDEQIWRRYERRLLELAKQRGIAIESLYFPSMPLLEAPPEVPGGQPLDPLGRALPGEELPPTGAP